MVLVGKRASDFTAKAVSKNGSVVENFILSEEMKGKMFVLYFYPLDFTFVCPSEIIAFDNRLGEFTSRNTKVIGVSVDSHFSHLIVGCSFRLICLSIFCILFNFILFF
jgi:peroxiredoxin (alkyl hydroperoxide reductase subunit C)